ncbi:glycosyltransferase [bacterium]|nr:glycosyltransferase [bacterium]
MATVSIVTIAFNDVKRIERTIRSIRDQLRHPDQYIVMDGGSEDGTTDIVARYPDVITTYSSEPDEGIYDAMNKGIRVATGEWIGIVNAGDFYFPWTINTVLQFAESSDADILHGNQMVFTEYPSFSYFRHKQPSSNSEDLENKPSIFHPTCFVKKALYERIGLFDESYRVDADYEFLLRAKREGARFAYVPQTLTGFQTGGVSGGCTRFSEGYRILKEYGIPRYTSNTVKLLRCLLRKAIAFVVDIDRRVEKKRLQESKS